MTTYPNTQKHHVTTHIISLITPIPSYFSQFLLLFYLLTHIIIIS